MVYCIIYLSSCDSTAGKELNEILEGRWFSAIKYIAFHTSQSIIIK